MTMPIVFLLLVLYGLGFLHGNTYRHYKRLYKDYK